MFLSRFNNWRRWVTSTSHKDISFMYFAMGWSGGMMGTSLSWLIRHSLVYPSSKMSGHLYNTIVTSHALMMIFFLVMPTLMGGFGNYLIPMQIGVSDLVFPRMNLLSLMLIPTGLTFLLCGMFMEGGAGTSWTYYPPLSTEGHYGISVDFSIISLHIMGVSSLVASFNFMTTILIGKGPMTLEMIMLFCWTLLVSSFLLVISLPVLACGLTMLLWDRNLNSSFFDAAGGGNAVLYQNLFWFFGHPEVYVLGLPAFGIISHACIILSGKDGVESYLGMVYSILSIGTVGCAVWAHHMYVASIDADSRAYFTAATMVIAIPTGIKVYTWLLTLSESYYKSSVLLSWVLGFIFMFTIGGVTGVVLSSAALDVNFHDTYFVTAHFHYVLSMGAVFGIFTGVVIYWPVISKLAFCNSMFQGFFNMFFIGVNMTFFPMHLLGTRGHPRKYKQISDDFRKLVQISSNGSNMSMCSIFLFMTMYVDAFLSFRMIVKINSFSSSVEHCVEHKAHTFESGISIYYSVI